MAILDSANQQKTKTRSSTGNVHFPVECHFIQFIHNWLVYHHHHLGCNKLQGKKKEKQTPELD